MLNKNKILTKGLLFLFFVITLSNLLFSQSFAQWDIFTYAQNGDSGGIRYLLSQGVDVNATNENGATALMEAAYANHYEAVALLLAAGATDVNHNYRQSLMLATLKGSPELVQLLIDTGVDFDPSWLLYIAIRNNPNPNVIKLILNKGAYINHGFNYYSRQVLVGHNLLNSIPKNHTDVLAVMKEEFNKETIDHIDPENLDHALLLMTQVGGPKLVKALLEAGAAPRVSHVASKYPPMRKSAFGYALERETDEIARLLVAYGLADDFTVNELTEAIALASFDNDDWLMELLAQKPDLSDMSSSFVCAKMEHIELLLAAGAPLNGNINNLRPPISQALFCHDDKLERLEKLLTAGANPNTVNIGGETTLMLTSRSRNSLDSAKLLLDYDANPNIRDYQGRNALMSRLPLLDCAEFSNYSACKHAEYAEYVSNYPLDPIMPNSCDNCSSRSGKVQLNIEVVKTLLANGAELMADDKGVTPLMDVFALGNRHPFNTIQKAKKENIIALAQTYLDYGANVEARDHWGRTPLMYAVANRVFEGVQLLLTNGANVNAKDNEGRTALFYAYSSEIIELLYAYGSDLNLVNNKGLAPIHSVFWGCLSIREKREEWFTWYSSGFGEGHCVSTIKTLLKLGVNPNIKDVNGMTPLMYLTRKSRYRDEEEREQAYNVLIEAGANLEIRDNKGLTASLHAAQADKWFTWKEFLAASTDPNLQDFEGNSALMLAIKQGHTRNMNSLLEIDIPLNIRNSKGETALILLGQFIRENKDSSDRWEIESYAKDMAKLLDSGADASIKDNKGKTALDYLREVERFHDTEAYKRLISLSTP